MPGARLLCRHATSVVFAVVMSVVVVPTEGAILLNGDTNPSYTGADPWDVDNTLIIGGSGIGGLTINGGSMVEDTNGYIGQFGGSSGSVTVNGAGSTWTHSQTMRVGQSGSGVLTIENGGAVSGGNSYIGYNSTGVGVATVTGAGSVWDNTSQLIVGRSGTGTLNIENGGTVNSLNGQIGDNAGSNGTATVTGAGSVWNNTFDLLIPSAGTGMLNIESGGAVTVGRNTYVDQNGTGSGSIQFNNGTLDTAGLFAASSDLAGTGTINTQTILSDVDLVFDSVSGLTPQLVLNSLPGQNITINVNAPATGGEGVMGAGLKGVGTLTVTDGLTVSSGEGYLGYFSGSDGSATVSGAGSAWDNAGDLYVGKDGKGALLIENGGAVSNATAFVDDKAGPGSTATVTGVDSVWDIAGELYIGQEGLGSLTIENGGTVNVALNTAAGREAIGTGVIEFNNGTLNTGGLLASPAELMGMGTINTSGLISDVNLQFDAGTGYQSQVVLNSLPGQNITINVDPTTSTDALLLGAGNRGVGTLSIADGLSVPSAFGILGYYTGSSGTADVAGAGTAWNNSEDLYVGLGGRGTLNVSDGAGVGSLYGIVGGDVGSVGTATLTGGSVWVNDEDLVVGLSGVGTVNVTQGSFLSSNSGLIGSDATSIGTVNVVGAGSGWDNALVLVVATYGSGALHITQGATVSDFSGIIASESGSVGTVMVHGAGSMWTNQFALTIGGVGAATLSIVDGGVVSNTNGFIGQSIGGTGTVTVSGAGSAWQNTQELLVGMHGTGTLIIQEGATVHADDGLIIGRWDAGAGTVNLFGGTLDMNGTPLSQGDGAAVFNFTGGTLVGASMIDIGGPFVQSGGTLAPGASIGLTEIVGDYELGAGTLEIKLGGIGNPIDLVSVSGDIDVAALGTTLDLHALGPMAAGTYTLLESTGGTVTGMFESVTTFNLFGVNVIAQNTGSAIVITLDGDLVLADPNLDGFVGIADLNIVLGNWNQNVTPGDVLAGDLDGDGFVGIADLNAVLGSWNQGTPPAGAAATVPEPVGVAVLAAGVVGMLGRRLRA